ncbi:MAG: Dna2/Cas4 domain-containing protein [Ruminococcus sp.]|nr:Dna2/Cas4 domain-containing protein [Ruminococcus sp.]
MDIDRSIPLSYISQYNYCKRRAALLMLEQQWSDSADTVKGTAEHKNVHSAGIAFRDNKYVLTELQVF